MAPRNSKVAFVTGCSQGGIGFSFCEKLLGRGYIVYATARSVESMHGLEHPNVRKLSLDVTSDDQVGSVVQTIIDEEGRVDLVINNAGVLAPGPTVDYSSAEVKAVYDANVFSIQRVAHAVVPHMAKRKQGTIVNMGSIVGEYPTPWMGIYDSSKAAVRIMSEVLSMECRPFNIKVVLVAPSSIKSKIVMIIINFLRDLSTRAFRTTFGNDWKRLAKTMPCRRKYSQNMLSARLPARIHRATCSLVANQPCLKL